MPEIDQMDYETAVAELERTVQLLGKEQEDLAIEAQKKGQLDSLVVRLPDFYGPGADNSLANPIFQAALAGKTSTAISGVRSFSGPSRP